MRSELDREPGGDRDGEMWVVFVGYVCADGMGVGRRGRLTVRAVVHEVNNCTSVHSL